MAVTTSQIRNLLNRPPHLVEDTINEYLTMRTLEADKIARNSNYNIATANQVTTADKEEFIKASVACDCLTVLIDTIPSLVVEDGGANDTRFRFQLKRFQERADRFRDLIAEPNSSAFATDKTVTRQE